MNGPTTAQTAQRIRTARAEQTARRWAAAAATAIRTAMTNQETNR